MCGNEWVFFICVSEYLLCGFGEGGEEERCINPPFPTDQESNNNQKRKKHKTWERERGEKKRRKKNWVLEKILQGRDYLKFGEYVPLCVFVCVCVCFFG